MLVQLVREVFFAKPICEFISAMYTMAIDNLFVKHVDMLAVQNKV